MHLLCHAWVQSAWFYHQWLLAQIRRGEADRGRPSKAHLKLGARCLVESSARCAAALKCCLVADRYHHGVRGATEPRAASAACTRVQPPRQR